jgi:hypothetical protein
LEKERVKVKEKEKAFPPVFPPVLGSSQHPIRRRRMSQILKSRSMLLMLWLINS